MLIHYVHEMRLPIKDSAEALGMNYSTAKSILSLYKKTGRINRIDRLRAEPSEEAQGAEVVKNSKFQFVSL
jgi:hypothetical protein